MRGGRRPRHVRLTEPLVRENGALFSCSKATNEMNFAAQNFARVVMGSNNVDSCNRT